MIHEHTHNTSQDRVLRNLLFKALKLIRVVIAVEDAVALGSQGNAPLILDALERRPITRAADRKIMLNISRSLISYSTKIDGLEFES